MKSESVFVRLDPPSLIKLDAFVREMSERAYGAKLTRSDAIRVLLDRGLAAVAAERKAPRK